MAKDDDRDKGEKREYTNIMVVAGQDETKIGWMLR
jgi:hypothetical protein